MLYLEDGSALHRKPEEVTGGGVGSARVLLDPNVWDPEGTTAVKSTHLSHDERLLSYGVSQKGSDWVRLQFVHLPSGDPLPDTLEQVKFSGGTFTHDNRGVLYCVCDPLSVTSVFVLCSLLSLLYICWCMLCTV